MMNTLISMQNSPISMARVGENAQHDLCATVPRWICAPVFLPTLGGHKFQTYVLLLITDPLNIGGFNPCRSSEDGSILMRSISGIASWRFLLLDSAEIRTGNSIGNLIIRGSLGLGDSRKIHNLVDQLCIEGSSIILSNRLCFADQQLWSPWKASNVKSNF